MVAFNFSVFIDKVERREKRMTIRKTARAKPGDKIQLYTGMRTKACRKLVDEDAELLLVEPITVSEDKIETKHIVWEGHGMWNPNGLARLDGFDDFEDMKTFFRDSYGLPFSGYAHMWHWPESNHPITGNGERE